MLYHVKLIDIFDHLIGINTLAFFKKKKVVKKQQKLVFLWNKTFLAFLALSREKRGNISRISREIKNMRNVHV